MRYIGDNAAQVSLPGGRHGVVESLEPMAVRTSHGGHAPIDLRLRDERTGFEPVFPVVGVRVPKRLGSGVALEGTGVSLTPVDVRGSALAGSPGTVDGVSVVYANTLTDADTVVKAITAGFAVETVLRSVRSPRLLYFQVGMPAGARLVSRGGAADVVEHGVVIARVLAPGARDAEGTSVPVSMRVVGDELLLTVASLAGRYRLPVAVDPTVVDNSCGEGERTAWYTQLFGEAFHAPAHPEACHWTLTVGGTRTESEWGGLFYTTKGESQITTTSIEGNWNDSEKHLQNQLYLYDPNPYPEGKIEAYKLLPENTEGRMPSESVCSGCEGTVVVNSPEDTNTGFYQVYSTQKVENLTTVENYLANASVTITQPHGPEVSFNTTSATLYNGKEDVPNVLYGSGGWLGPHNGAFEVHARDAGIGLSYYRVTGAGPFDVRDFYDGSPAPPEFPDGCKGVQCPEHVSQGYLYNDWMSDGETTVETYVKDAACGLKECPAGTYAGPLLQKIKVDGAPPHDIKLGGMRNGDELPLGEAHLTVEASDGEGSTPSSGIKSITVEVDGHEVPSSLASCPEGPCTASSKLTLAARDYESGRHSLTVTAVDNANNVAQEEFTFRVHGASGVSVGPGSVDPSTGQLTLSASDVSLGAASVSRTYQSRQLTAGVDGPLGPQWTLNVGGDESLTIAVNGDAVLSASGGASTTFVHKQNGEFESPPGDGNLKLEAKEQKAGKGISEYVLKTEKQGTETRFEQPSNNQYAPPTFANRFGSEARQLNHPVSDAVDASGDVWVSDYQDGLIEKFSPTGTLEATYSSAATSGQFTSPWGIAVDPRNGDVYVTDQANNSVEELSSSGTFIKTFGWGVSNGKEEFEICTSECKAGITGAGNGQFSVVAGVTVDASGNVWVADYGNNRVQEFNEKGEFVQKFGSAGTEPGQFEGPMSIAFSGGNLYVTDYRNDRVQEFSTSGSLLGHFGEAGAGDGQFSHPYGIAADPITGNLYVIDSGNARVQQFTPAGAFLTKFGEYGTQPGTFLAPSGIAVNATGSVYVVDNTANLVDEWARSTWVPTDVGGVVSGSTTYAYQAVEGEDGKTVIEPTEALAPVPVGVSSCSPLARGCRALTFNYAEKTTATGENEREWGDYKGNLTRVYFHAWDPAKGAMSEVEVAHYLYDKQGRLRAEWDPRISPALKTIYGYDHEGHVTAITPPGQETWAFTYGTIAGSASPGRLLKVTRAGQLRALRRVAMPASVRPHSMLVYGVLASPPSELVVRTPMGQTVVNEHVRSVFAEMKCVQ